MLEIKNLSVAFEPGKSAVDDVSFEVRKGEILGVVGESGSGKSTLALSVLRLLPASARIAGQVLFHGHDLLSLEAEDLIHVRGAKIAMIFQDPFSSLNPVFSVGEQIAESIRLHQGLERKAAHEKAAEMLDLVKIKDAKKRINDYPHQFSGGMRQRVMIAMALACQPEILVADEPTTALDVTIQREILKLLYELREKLGLTILFITHNFGIVRQLCDRVVVMRAGRLVEEGMTKEILNHPRDEYTKELMGAIAQLTPKLGKGDELA